VTAPTTYQCFKCGRSYSGTDECPHCAGDPEPVRDSQPPSRSTWQPVDLTPWLNGDPPDDQPTILPIGTTALLYEKAVNSFAGEPESGKSWLALWASTVTLHAAGNVVYIDFESSPAVVVARLLALGAHPGTIAHRFRYLAPQVRLEAQDKLGTVVEDVAPRLVVLDGVTNAMSLFGLSISDNDAVAQFMRWLPRPLADLGPAVLLVDHVTKSKDDRGRYPLGAQHKLAAIDGAAYSIDVVAPFGRGRTGTVRLAVTKDRLGHVRGACPDGKTVAAITLASDPDSGTVTVTAEPWQPGSQWQPTQLMERISGVLQVAGELSWAEIRARVKGKTDYKQQALAELVNGGYVAVRLEGQKKVHRSVKPFTEPEPVPLSPTRPQPVPGTGRPDPETCPPVPPPLGGTGDRDRSTPGTPPEPVPSGESPLQLISTADLLAEDDPWNGVPSTHFAPCRDCGQDREVSRVTGRCDVCADPGLEDI